MFLGVWYSVTRRLECTKENFPRYYPRIFLAATRKINYEQLPHCILPLLYVKRRLPMTLNLNTMLFKTWVAQSCFIFPGAISCLALSYVPREISWQMMQGRVAANVTATINEKAGSRLRGVGSLLPEKIIWGSIKTCLSLVKKQLSTSPS